QHDWQAEQESEPTKKKRHWRKIVAGVALVGIVGLIGVLYWMIDPYKSVRVVLAGAGSETNLEVPHNALGWDPWEASRASLAAHGSDLPLFPVRRPPVSFNICQGNSKTLLEETQSVRLTVDGAKEMPAFSASLPQLFRCRLHEDLDAAFLGQNRIAD